MSHCPHTSEEVRVEVTTVPEEVEVTVSDQVLLLPFEPDHLILQVGQPTWLGPAFPYFSAPSRVPPKQKMLDKWSLWPRGEFVGLSYCIQKPSLGFWSAIKSTVPEYFSSVSYFREKWCIIVRTC